MKRHTLLILATAMVATTSPLAVSAQTATPTAKPEVAPMARVTAARAKAETTRVFGGKQADKGEWPFQVALLSSDKLDDTAESQPNAQFCGGSLIAPQWVLTAAHCLSNYGSPVAGETVTVLAGATHLSEGKRYQVAEVIVHEGYSELTFDNDIGLLKLATPADTPTIALPKAAADDAGRVTVIGWGMMRDGSFPNDLQEAEVDLQPNSACNTGIKEVYANDLSDRLQDLAIRMRFTPEGIVEGTAVLAKSMSDPLTANMICAGTMDGERDACNGDSGGPLFAVNKDERTQLGIVSWGEGPENAGAACGHKNAFGVYTRVSNYLEWIKTKTGI